jgi:hypothetical protein
MASLQCDAAIALFEGVRSSLHNRAYRFPNRVFLKAAFTLLLRFSAARGESNYQLGVTVDDDVRVVCNHDHLPMAFNLPQLRHDQVIDQVVVQIAPYSFSR